MPARRAVGVCTVGAGALWVALNFARGARRVVAISLVGAVLIGDMVVVGTDAAGTKPGTNDVTQVEGGTNQIENGKWRMENAGGCTTILRSPFSILHSTSSVTDGIVESLFGYGDNPFIMVNARVGADHIKKTNAEVYTK